MPISTTRSRSTGSQNKAKTETWALRLYIAGQTPRAIAALTNLKMICEAHRKEYTIEVIDLLKTPQLAKGDQILAVPTLVKYLPLPVRRVIGDLSDAKRVLAGLDISAA